MSSSSRSSGVSLSRTTEKNNLPVLRGDEARDIDLRVTDRVGRVRILESVATRIADVLHYHILTRSSTTDGGLPDFDTPLIFVAGKGNNGANAMAAARLLAFRGFTNISLVPLLELSNDTTKTPQLRPNIAEQLDLFRQIVGADCLFPLDLEKIRSAGADAILMDGVLGTGITDPPRGNAGAAIRALNEAAAKVVAIDIPSGLNHVTGEPAGNSPETTVQATWTINLHMFKSGQLEPAARPYIGQLYSVETALGFTTFPDPLPRQFQEFYRTGPIQKVSLPSTT